MLQSHNELIRALVSLAALTLLGSAPAVHAQETPAAPARRANSLALEPPMGWNSWNKFGCNVDERLIRNTADAMVSSGMRDAGYEYVVIDDCWHGTRDTEGRIQPDPARFPSGMKALGDYIHSRQLKFGIYSDAGRKTCGGRPGSQGYEFQDARQYASWGVDYLKYDWCNTGKRNEEEAYALMADALRESGRDIVLSMCEWGTAKPWLWAQNIGNLWRTTGDIYDAWEGAKGHSHGMLDILDQQVGLESFAGPGHWNDPDMLEVGNGGMSESEYRAHFALWAMLAAPLMAGNDIPNMDAATRSILLNREIIAVDQDPLGKPASRISGNGAGEVWARPLADGSRAVLFLNRGERPLEVSVTAVSLGFPAYVELSTRDLWLGKTLRSVKARIATVVKPHAAVIYRITP
jgi:alpha-galactosidase